MPKTRTSLCAALITSMLVVPIGTTIAIPRSVSALSVVVVTTASDVVDAADGQRHRAERWRAVHQHRARGSDGPQLDGDR